jgi:hypothetical protein
MYAYIVCRYIMNFYWHIMFRNGRANLVKSVSRAVTIMYAINVCGL